MALALFAHQFENNESFRRFCLKKGRSPRTVRTWREIPPVPISAFKTLTLSCVAPESAERVFMTSGTTGGARGRCYHPTLAVYDRSMIANFRQRFMRGREKIRMGILFPTEEEMPNSSLAHYLALAVGNFGTPDSEYLLNQKGLENDLLFRALDEAAATGEPCALLGATYSFVHAFDEMRRGGRRYSLPPGSRILDTGGFKGRSRDVEATEFYGRMGVAARRRRVRVHQHVRHDRAQHAVLRRRQRPAGRAQVGPALDPHPDRQPPVRRRSSRPANRASSSIATSPTTIRPRRS